MDEFRLDGALAVVIGASQGIGQAIALAFAAAGANVVAASRSLSRLEETLDLAASHRNRISAAEVDVALPESVGDLAARATADKGQALILVNSAAAGTHKDAFAVTPEDWDAVHDVHLRGTFFACQAFGRVMQERGYGKIINLSSIWASTSAPRRSVYGAAKAGVSQLTAALAVEWAPLGIRVNALAPAATRTQGTAKRLKDQPDLEAALRKGIPLGRIAETSDMTGPAIFLASRASDYVTGQTLYVDGGWQFAKQ